MSTIWGCLFIVLFLFDCNSIPSSKPFSRRGSPWVVLVRLLGAPVRAANPAVILPVEWNRPPRPRRGTTRICVGVVLLLLMRRVAVELRLTTVLTSVSLTSVSLVTPGFRCPSALRMRQELISTRFTGVTALSIIPCISIVSSLTVGIIIVTIRLSNMTILSVSWNTR